MSQFGPSRQPFMSAIFRYGLAVLSVAAALFIRELLRTYFEPTPNSFFFCAIALTSWLGGFGPGLVASLLSVEALDYHFSAPYYVKMSAEDLPRVVVFFVTAASISWLSAS